jgi:putative Ca2+/H+ antiporter (TMEM165/GDT1 family)
LEPLLTAFVAALLGGWGDKTQGVAARLADRYRARALLPALVIAVAGNSLASAFAGTLLRREVTPNAATLLVAIALLFAGVAGLIGEKPKAPKERGGPFLASLAALLGAGWGDKTQYVVAALAAYWDSFLPVACAACAATLAVTLPAAAGGEAFARAAPLRSLRIVAAGLFLLAGVGVLVTALHLV